METSNAAYRSAVRVAAGVALVLSLPLVAMLTTDDVVWSLADFVLAGVLIAAIGVAFELAVRKAGNRVIALGIAAVGVAAAMLGEADDAPASYSSGSCSSSAVCARHPDRPHRS